jgi:hypothetical protein
MAKKMEQRFNVEMEKDAPNLDFCLKLYTTTAAYAYGRPRERRELSGPGGGAIQQQQIVEAAQRVAEAFDDAAASDDPGTKLADEDLRGVQAINFIMAQKELAARHAGQAAEKPAGVPPGPAAPRSADTPDAAPAVPVEARQGVLGSTDPEPPAEPQAPPEGHTIAFLDSEYSITGCPPDRAGLSPVYLLKLRGQLVRRGPFDICLKLLREKAGGSFGPWLVQAPPKSAGQHYNGVEQRAGFPCRPAGARESL